MFRVRSHDSSAGFTLIELMITLVIAALLLSLAGPGLSSILERNRVKLSADTMFTALMLSRSEALKRNQYVVMCKSADGATCVTTGEWEQGWMIYADADRDGAKDVGEPVVGVQEALKSGDTLRVSGADFDDQLTYMTDGSASGTGTFVVCNSDEDTDIARELVVAITGRPRMNKTTTDCTP